MHRILFVLIFAIIAPLTVLAQQTAGPVVSGADPKARALEVLKQARAVIWDEAKSKRLQSLTINATSRIVQGQGESTNEITLDVLLPDKFLQTSSRFLGAAEFISILAINGTQTWSDFKQPDLSAMADAKAAMAGDAAKGDAYAAKKGAAGGSFGGAGGGAMPQVNQMELERMVLAWLLITPGTLPVEFTYAGEARANGQSADVLDVKGPNNFAARLFIAQQTHQLLMLTYQAKIPVRNPQRDAQVPNQEGKRSANPPTPEEIEKRRAAHEKEMQEAQANASEVEVRWVVSDYRSAGGLSLPHRLTKSTGGQVTGEITINKVKVNPSLKPDRFERKGAK